MKKHIMVATLSLSILLLGGTTALAINTQSTPDQNTAKIVKQNNHKAPCSIQNIECELTDIQDDWAHEEVLEAQAKGFVTGYADFTFRPNSSVTKLETLVMIINAAGLTEKAQDYNLSDEQKASLAKIPDWGQKYIALALDEGILTAEELSNFNPQQATKRYEVCMYMSRILTNDDPSTDAESKQFTDEDQIPSGNKMQVRLMAMNGIVSGYPDGKFQPMKAVKRNEIITMLNKLDENCLQASTSSTVKGTVKEMAAIDGGYALTIETSNGETLVVKTTTQSKLIYKGHLLSTALNIGSTLDVKILLDQDGNAVFVKFMGAGEGTATVDDLDDADKIVERNEPDKLNQHNKHDKSNKPMFLDKTKAQKVLDQIDQIDEIDELDEIDEIDEFDVLDKLI